MAEYSVSNTDSFDPDPGFWWPRNWKKLQKLKFTYPWASGRHKGRPSYRRSLQPLKENIHLFFNMKFLYFLRFFCVIFALLDPDLDPGTDPLTWLNPDPKHWFTNCVWRLVWIRAEPKRKYSSDLEPGGKKTKNENIASQERTLSVRSFIKGWFVISWWKAVWRVRCRVCYMTVCVCYCGYRVTLSTP